MLLTGLPEENEAQMVRKVIVVVFLALFFVITPFSLAQNSDSLQTIQNKIREYEEQIRRLNLQSTTLFNQIAQYDAQIKLTTLRIEEIGARIDLIAGRIDGLKDSVESLSAVHTQRVVEEYKYYRVDTPLLFFIFNGDLSAVLKHYTYLRRIQNEDAVILSRLTAAKDNYENQKKEQEKLFEQLKLQEASLANQKKAKANLLTITKNDEKRYQNLLASARAEYEAIQAIVSGRGTETEVGDVSEGATIASIIQGSSCNSSGSHLHFIVGANGQVKNPFEYLSSGVGVENCSGSSCGSSDGDAFNPSGSWRWPISATIKFMQGYGSTWAVRNSWVGRIYNFHNGIDINSGDSTVRAVKAGKLYRGSYGGSAGCRLRYVRVDHADSDLETYYLHVNY